MQPAEKKHLIIKLWKKKRHRVCSNCKNLGRLGEMTIVPIVKSLVEPMWRYPLYMSGAVRWHALYNCHVQLCLACFLKQPNQKNGLLCGVVVVQSVPLDISTPNGKLALFHW